MSTKKRSDEHAHHLVQKRSLPPITREHRDALDEMESGEVTEQSLVSAASVDATEYANEFDVFDLPTGDWSG
jgi:hypothetical protein